MAPHESPAFVDVSLYGETTHEAAPRVAETLFDLCEQRFSRYTSPSGSISRTPDILRETTERMVAIIDAGHEIANGIRAVRLRFDDWAEQLGLGVLCTSIEPLPIYGHFSREDMLTGMRYSDFPTVNVIPANSSYYVVIRAHTGDTHQRISPLSRFIRVGHDVTPVDPCDPFPYKGFTLSARERGDVIDMPAHHSYVVAAPIVAYSTYDRVRSPHDYLADWKTRVLDIDKGQVYFSEAICDDTRDAVVCP